MTTPDATTASRSSDSDSDSVDVARRHPPEHRGARGCDALLDLAVAVLASWTLVYHVCLVADLAVTWAVILECLTLVAWAGLRRRSRGRRPASPAPASTDSSCEAQPGASTWQRVLWVATGATALSAAVLVAVNAPWPLVASMWLIASVGGASLASTRLRRAEGTPDANDSSADTWVALGWASGLAVLSLFTLRPNPDDLYYVNLSQWVVDHGTFPRRDTIFSDQLYPMSSWPPVASYDALVGTAARLIGAHAASVVYVVVPPVATFLAVLALWRLLRAWRVRPVWVALSVGLVFLLFDAGAGYATPGNLFLTRLWQGKVILLCLMVPTLLVYALRYVDRPTRGRAGWLFAGGVAAVGLSTSAIFVVPLIALAGAAPLVLRAPRLAWGGFAAMAAYPVAAGMFTIAVHGHSADDFGSRRLYRFDPSWFGHQIFLDGVIALVAVTAALVGSLLVPHRAARLTTALLALFTGITFIPGVTHLSYDLVGLGPTLWRVSWVASIAALVGVLAASAAQHPPWRGRWPVAPLALVGAVVLGGLPIWSSGAGVGLALPPHWQRSERSVAAASDVVDALEPGDVVLAAPDLGITIDVMTTRIKTVAPRKYFMDYLKDEPGFHYTARGVLMDFVNPPPGTTSDPAQVVRALGRVDVTAVCLGRRDEVQLNLLRQQGFTPLLQSPGVVCVRR